jgi:hypothetical protein
LFDIYINFHLQEQEQNLESDLHKLIDYNNLFQTFKSLKSLHVHLLDSVSPLAKDIIYFYYNIVERNSNYSSCVKLISKYENFNKKLNLENSHNNSLKDNFQIFGTRNLDKEKMENIKEEYISNYFEREDMKKRRSYKMENAGFNWSEQDTLKFEEGVKLYGHCQLANNKIAKYMGQHIETSHVKLFRSKISKKRRLQKKVEKEEKISEMKKKRNLRWKAAPSTHQNE